MAEAVDDRLAALIRERISNAKYRVERWDPDAPRDVHDSGGDLRRCRELWEAAKQELRDWQSILSAVTAPQPDRLAALERFVTNIRACLELMEDWELPQAIRNVLGNLDHPPKPGETNECASSTAPAPCPRCSAQPAPDGVTAFDLREAARACRLAAREAEIRETPSASALGYVWRNRARRLCAAAKRQAQPAPSDAAVPRTVADEGSAAVQVCIEAIMAGWAIEGDGADEVKRRLLALAAALRQGGGT